MASTQDKTETAAEIAARVGLENFGRIRDWGALHPFGTQAECAEALGLHISTIQRHVASIRETWRRDDRAAGAGNGRA